MSTPQAIRSGTTHHSAHDADSELLKVDERLHEEMERLAAINRELLGKPSSGSNEAYGRFDEPDEVALLRGENSELRARLEELEQALQTTEPADGTWAERQKEYEAMLEEKSEVIRALHLKIQELQEGGATTGQPATDAADSQRIQVELAEQRRQLEADEESLMQQMRQMEVAMSKDRAELARQRNEIQRLHSELNHEIENASRDPALRDRLVALQKLQGEMTGRKQQVLSQSQANISVRAAAPAPAKIQSSGLLRRIFGK